MWAAFEKVPAVCPGRRAEPGHPDDSVARLQTTWPRPKRRRAMRETQVQAEGRGEGRSSPSPPAVSRRWVAAYRCSDPQFPYFGAPVEVPAPRALPLGHSVEGPCPSALADHGVRPSQPWGVRPPGGDSPRGNPGEREERFGATPAASGWAALLARNVREGCRVARMFGCVLGRASSSPRPREDAPPLRRVLWRLRGRRRGRQHRGRSRARRCNRTRWSTTAATRSSSARPMSTRRSRS